MCVCVGERERESLCERESHTNTDKHAPLGERSRKTPLPHELGSVAELSVRRERVRVCEREFCVSEREKEKERERECVRERQSERERERETVRRAIEEHADAA